MMDPFGRLRKIKGSPYGEIQPYLETLSHIFWDKTRQDIPDIKTIPWCQEGVPRCQEGSPWCKEGLQRCQEGLPWCQEGLPCCIVHVSSCFASCHRLITKKNKNMPKGCLMVMTNLLDRGYSIGRSSE